MKALIKFLMRFVPRPMLIRFSYPFRAIIKWFYKGDKYQCSICDEKFRKLLPYGFYSRENALCPNCLSLERHRLMWYVLQNKTNFFTANLKVLHVAPEQAFLERFSKMKNLSYDTADLVSPIATIKMDIQDMPIDDNTYDVVFCNHVLEHVTDDHKAMTEIYRVLKPGGFAITQVPLRRDHETTYEDPTITSRKEREIHFGQYDHVRWYGLDYPAKLKDAGFDVEEIYPYEEIGEEGYIKHCLPKEERLYLLHKS